MSIREHGGDGYHGLLGSGRVLWVSQVHGRIVGNKHVRLVCHLMRAYYV